MSSKKMLVAFGATGNQGGSVIKDSFEDPVTAKQFHIGAITKDVRSRQQQQHLPQRRYGSQRTSELS